jgi:hypothetical protein
MEVVINFCVGPLSVNLFWFGLMAISFVSDDDDTTEVDTPRRGIDTLQRQY